MNFSEQKTIVVGSGLAGLYSALKLAENTNKEILLITKAELEEANSKYAQGGIVAVMSENVSDNVKLHVQDTLKAGAGLSDNDVVEFISKNSEAVINDLLSQGVDFDRDENNNLKFTMEGAHSARRILHSGGDATGFYMEQALAKKVKCSPNIKIRENMSLVEILVNNSNKCCGIITFDNKTNEYNVFYSNTVVLATGGIGQLYKFTTNPSVTTGDGLSAAYRAGALMQDMEFIQFHPTAFDAKNEENMFLISEAVRGEGAKLRDENGNTFMAKYDDRLELASRDIVTRAIYNETKNKKISNVFLDATVIEKEKLNKRFPTILGVCRKNGINPETDYIPVSPAAHYLMGGIKTNINGETSIKNLYAIGETSCTGLHGANRLASNSLLECVVSAYELAKFLKDKTKNQNVQKIKNDDRITKTIKNYEQNLTNYNLDFLKLKQQIQELMWQKVGIIRNETDLKSALNEMQKLNEEFTYTDKCPSKDAYEVRNLLTIGKLVIEFALNRRESRGGHYREDYKNISDIPKHYAKTINDNKYEEIYVK